MFYIMLFSPLFGSLLEALNIRNPKLKYAGMASSLFSFFAFLAAVIIFSKKLYGESLLLPWFSSGGLELSFYFKIDSLNSIMALLVTGVAFLIHIYSLSYMKEDRSAYRYFSYLSLFVFNMLILTSAGSLPLLFVGWEGVGLCSYLLIGFWFKDVEKARCGELAFLTNRAGDACFLIGMFILFSQVGSFEFSEINIWAAQQANLGFTSPLSLSCLFLFLGAAGKSAQIPLYFWLPRAMAGPTPVSALIHAATMVTAGVYMILRLAPTYMQAPDVLNIISYVAAIGSLLAALVACRAFDLKRILAYSTISQLGYMFMAVGGQAFTAGFFHLLTHGLFKALLFLCAGSVIHGMNGEQDIRKMGTLPRYFPKTFLGFVVGSLSLMALPPFSGFFSKDEILLKLFSGQNYFVFALSFITGLITVFYVTRMMMYLFFSKETFKGTPHESPPFMWVPILFLSGLAFIAGGLGMPHIFSDLLPFHFPHILDKLLPELNLTPFTIVVKTELILMSSAVSASLLVAGFATWMYRAPVSFSWMSGLRSILEKELYINVFIDDVIKKFFVNFSLNLDKSLENFLIKDFFQSISKLLYRIQNKLNVSQSGNAQSYGFYMFLGLIALLSLMFMK